MKEQSPMRRNRYQAGSLKRRDDKWIGQWWEGKSRRNRVLGTFPAMSKSAAMTALQKILADVKVSEGNLSSGMSLAQFVEGVYYPFYKRKWKNSTNEANINRVNNHILSVFGEIPVSDFKRNGLQAFLDKKANTGLSYSMVAHMRWDLNQIFEMAVSEDLISRNPAKLLFVPSNAKVGERQVMSLDEVRRVLSVLDLREKLVVQLAVIAGMRPGEIFGLTWQHVGWNFVDITQRVYRGEIDTPKTKQSVRKAALADGVLESLDEWRALSLDARPKAWVFPTERGTPQSRDNMLRRFISPRLEAISLGWVDFQVMRRTHSTLMNNMGVEGKLVADQLGHSLDVNQNVYTQSPIHRRKAVVDQLEQALEAS
jgi:integrase